MKVFDIRTDDSHEGFIAAVNRGLDSEPGNPYLTEFGHVGSPRWWAALDHGELPVEVLSGEVSLVGARPEPWSDEPEDVIEFVCSGQAIAYDRVEHWAAVPIHVGDRITITRTIAELATRAGPIRYLIDLRAEWVAADQRYTEPDVTLNSKPKDDYEASQSVESPAHPPA